MTRATSKQRKPGAAKHLDRPGDKRATAKRKLAEDSAQKQGATQ